MSAVRTFVCECFVVAALSALASIRPSPASADEQPVKFDSAAPRLHQAEGHLAGAGAKIADGKLGAPIQGYLTRPNGRGPFPAIVLLHSCLGLPATRQSMANVFAGWGYVTLFVDDFTTRGVKETCAEDFSEGVSDAFGALAFLSKLPFVDPRRIGAVGYSQGGDTALEIASSRFVSAFALPGEVKFKVAAAFYPPCENLGNAELKIPTLILVGELDDVTPAADCERLAQAQPSHVSAVKLVVYPGAGHGFDNPDFADGLRVLGMSLRYDRDAAELSGSELRAFLATRLTR